MPPSFKPELFRKFSVDLHDQAENCDRAAPSMLDSSDMGSPQKVWGLLCSKDAMMKRNWNLQMHPKLTYDMRFMVIHWLMEVCDERKLHRETFHLAVDYFDRFLANTKAIAREKLQLIGTAALTIAVKMEEIYPPKIEDIAEYTDGACKVDDVLRMELAMMVQLEWNFTPVTTIHWLGLYLQLLSKTNHDEPNLIRRRPPLTELNSTPDECTDTQATTTTEDSQCSRSYSFDCSFSTLDLSLNESSLNMLDLNSSYSDGHLIVDQPYTLPKSMRAEFVQLAKVVDLLILDYRFLKYRYGELAAAILFCTYEPSEGVEQVTGISKRSISKLVEVVQYYVEYAEERATTWQYQQGVNRDDAHNIQTYEENTDAILVISKRMEAQRQKLMALHKSVKR